MAKTLPTIDINNDNWGDLIGRVNQIVTSLSTEIMTANGDPVTGDSTLNGSFYADQLYDSNVRVATQAVNIVAGTGLTGGGTLANNIITVSINSNTAASLSKMDDLTDANTSTSGLMSAADKTKLDSVANGASVSSVAISVPTGFSVSGSPITSSGTFALSFAAGYEGFTTALKNSINSSVQTSGNQTVNGTKTFSSAIAFSGTAAANTRTNLGLGNSATLNTGTTSGTVAQGDDSRIVNAVPNSRTISPGTGLTGGGDLSANRSLSVSFGTTSGTVARGNDSRITGALQTSGGTMTGFLTLNANPTSNLHSATKRYVDTQLASKMSVYTGTGARDTVFPVGHIVNYGFDPDPPVALNGVVSVRLSTVYNSQYTTSGTGSLLAGTWRKRGSQLGQRVS